MLFQKLAENFVLDLDVKKIELNFIADVVDQPHKPYFDPSGKPHYQTFETGINYARNFYKNFYKECLYLTNRLKFLQQTLIPKKSTNQLTDIFLEHKIKPENFSLIKIKAGISIKPHRDLTRNYCINIGVLNTNTCSTQIAQHKNTKNFFNEEFTSYIQQDYEVYILRVEFVHAVQTLVKPETNLDRYLVTYSIFNT